MLSVIKLSQWLKQEENHLFFLLMEFENEKGMNKIKELYKQNASKMYHIAMAILNNSNNAEDAVHDAFVSIVKNVRRYDKLTMEEMEALCVVITKNKCLDQIRRTRRLSPIDVEELRLPVHKMEATPEEIMIRAEHEYEFQRMIDDLPEIYKEIIILRYYYAFGVKKIAKLLDVPVKTVDSRLYRAKSMMRRVIEDEEKRNR